MKRLLLCLGLMCGFVLCGCDCVSAAQTIDVNQELDNAYSALDGIIREQNNAHSLAFRAIAPDADLKKKKRSIQMYSTAEVNGKTLLMRAVEVGDIKRIKFVLENIVFSCDPYLALKTIMRSNFSQKNVFSYLDSTEKSKSIFRLIVGTVFMVRFGLYNSNAALIEIKGYSVHNKLDFNIDSWISSSPLLFDKALNSISNTGRYHVETGNYSYIPLDSRLDDEILNFLRTIPSSIGDIDDGSEGVVRKVTAIISKQRYRDLMKENNVAEDSSDEGNEKTEEGFFDFFKKKK